MTFADLPVTNKLRITWFYKFVNSGMSINAAKEQTQSLVSWLLEGADESCGDDFSFSYSGTDDD